MPIKIIGTNGHNAGRVFSFDEHKEVILFGRSDSADVRFPADNTLVSRQHLSLKLEHDRYKIVIRAENSAYVDGEEAYPGDELSFGEHRLVIGLPDSQEVFQLEVSSQDSDMAETQPAIKIKKSVRQQTQQLKKAYFWAFSLFAVVCTVGFIYLKHGSQSLHQQINALANASQTAIEKANFEQVLRNKRESVYLVAVQGPDTVEGVGTAWVVAKGVLATNAHVVEALEENLKENGATHKAVIISSKAPDYQLHEVTEMQIHPHYEAFASQHSHSNKVNFDGTWLDFVPSYDIGLLEVDKPELLAPVLPIASDAALLELDSGMAVGLIGFPQEGSVGGGINLLKPSAQVQMGHLTSVTDFFFTAQEKALNHLIQHNLPSHGGASGSPIFDTKGEVIAIHNAGNSTVVDNKRIKTGVGVNFAQRADLVKELLLDKVKINETQRFSYWQGKYAAYKTPIEIAVSNYKANLLAKGLDLTALSVQHSSETIADATMRDGFYWWESTLSLAERATEILITVESNSSAKVNLIWVDSSGADIARYENTFTFAHVSLSPDDEMVYEWLQFIGMDDTRLYVYSDQPNTVFKLSVFAM
ncbi:trypsin-like peptidase domain-containing protein [Planctobacterium marinum]|uniref:FHA domain-containing protein n=1 Tax=Planctobacterium marinum TaxID=1631968 RepID=A0AA48HNN9_9ALTE|nr:hypothetical protein MACH26_13830 [Planctobacterium marinum]